MTVPTGSTIEIKGLEREDSDQVRRRMGLVLGAAVFAILLVVPLGSLSVEAHRLAAIMGAIVILWITEALPMPVTALLGAVACVALGVAPAREVFAPFADPLMFLFIGSFMIAKAIMLHRLDRRVAYSVLSLRIVGASPMRILFAFGVVTAFISAWISNTATTAMMYAIAMAILAFMSDAAGREGKSLDPRYAAALMLMTSFAASVGGLATPIGTPPNVIGLGFIRQLTTTELPFFSWMIIGVPVVLVMLLTVFFVFRNAGSDIQGGMAESARMLQEQRDKRGKWSTGEKSTVLAFGMTVFLWVLPGVIALAYGDNSPEYKALTARVPEGVAALIGASLLFMLPGGNGERAITWKDAAKIDWGIVLLYGGGFALGVLSFKTGLAESMGKGILGFLPISGETGLVVGSAIMAVILSEVTSNTASANMIVPVVISVSLAAGIDPVAPALAATMAASLGFMLPVSTPCNAIVYGSGYIPLKQMMRYGIVVDVVGVVVIIAAVKLLLPLVR